MYRIETPFPSKCESPANFCLPTWRRYRGEKAAAIAKEVGHYDLSRSLNCSVHVWLVLDPTFCGPCTEKAPCLSKLGPGLKEGSDEFLSKTLSTERARKLYLVVLLILVSDLVLGVSQGLSSHTKDLPSPSRLKQKTGKTRATMPPLSGIASV